MTSTISSFSLERLYLSNSTWSFLEICLVYAVFTDLLLQQINLSFLVTDLLYYGFYLSTSQIYCLTWLPLLLNCLLRPGVVSHSKIDQSFIHSTNRDILNTYYVPVTGSQKRTRWTKSLHLRCFYLWGDAGKKHMQTKQLTPVTDKKKRIECD